MDGSVAASIVPVNRHNVRSDDRQRIGPVPRADSDHEIRSEPVPSRRENWSDRPREIVDHAASRCNLAGIHAAEIPQQGGTLPPGYLSGTSLDSAIYKFTVCKIFILNGLLAKSCEPRSYVSSKEKPRVPEAFPSVFSISLKNSRLMVTKFQMYISGSKWVK